METDRGLTTTGGKGHSTTEPTLRSSVIALRTKSESCKAGFNIIMKNNWRRSIVKRYLITFLNNAEDKLGSTNAFPKININSKPTLTMTDSEPS